MGRKLASDEASPFYPPRARWSSLFFYATNGVRRREALNHLRAPEPVTFRAIAAGFLVPGLAVYLRGSRLWGQAAMAAAAGLFTAGLVWLGEPASNLAFGLLLSLHATGFVYYCRPLLAEEAWSSRVLFTFLVLLLLLLALYLPAQKLTERHLFTPIRFGGQTFILRRSASPDRLQRGDWVAYSLASNIGAGSVWFHGGVGFGPILAMANDHVGFWPNAFTVNGTPHPSLPHMPVSGEWIVPEKHWFIWPNLGISGHGNVGEPAISSAFMALADVAPAQYLGRPYQSWFWRKQPLP